MFFGEKISSLLILLWFEAKRLKFGHGYCINERDDEHNSTNYVVKKEKVINCRCVGLNK